MKTVIKTVYVSNRGREYETPKGALIDDFESCASNVICETFGEESCSWSPVLFRFLENAAAHPARFGRRLRRLSKMRQALIDYERAEAKQPDAIPF